MNGILPTDWRRNPGMAMRTARYTCIEHESLGAYIDVCPPANADGLFDIDEDAWAIAKLYTRHDELEGVQFRMQREIESKEDAAIVVRELIDVCYQDYADDIDIGSIDGVSAGVTVPESASDARRILTMISVRKIAPWVIGFGMIATGVAGLMGWISAGPGLVIALVIAAVILTGATGESYRAVSH